MNKVSKARQNLVDSYIKSLEEGTIPWKKGWEFRGMNHNPSTGTIYKGINEVILANVTFNNEYNDPRWMTFNQINKMGLKLHDAKGKGVFLEKYSLYDKETNKYIDFIDAKKIKDELDLNSEEFYERFKWISKSFVVFNGSLVEGLEPYVPENAKQFDVNELATKLIDNYSINAGVEIIEGMMSGGGACYVPSKDKIYLPFQHDFKNEYAYLSTKLHECCHSTGHESRLNRVIRNSQGSENYAKEELRAEIGSSFLCADIGLEMNSEVIDNHKAYIQHWIKDLKEKPEELFDAIRDAEKITEYVEENGNFKELRLEFENISNLENEIEEDEIEDQEEDLEL